MTRPPIPLTADEWASCAEHALPPHPPYVCTLHKGHDGDHEAHTPNGTLKLQWENT